MSFYATMQGTITFPNKEKFNEAIEKLADWIKVSDFEDEEEGELDGKLTTDEENFTINIPWGYYMNLSNVIDDIYKGTTGKIVGTSTDGVFLGWTIIDGIAKEYDLDKWAEENDNGEEVPNFEIDFDGYCEWQNEVENDFHETFGD